MVALGWLHVGSPLSPNTCLITKPNEFCYPMGCTIQSSRNKTMELMGFKGLFLHPLIASTTLNNTPLNFIF